MLSMKTAALFALACELGARLSNADDEATQSALREYGEQLGTAYQIYDDCVDVFGSESVAGKSLGTDLATGKATLPMLLALEQANEQERKSWLTLFKDGEAQADTVCERLVAAGIPGACREVVADMIARAKAALVNLPGPVEPLHDLADCLTAQLELLDD